MHIEVDAMFNLLCTALLAILMILDFNYWGFDYVGLVCAAALIINGVSHQLINARIMPLKHYQDDTSL